MSHVRLARSPSRWSENLGERSAKIFTDCRRAGFEPRPTDHPPPSSLAYRPVGRAPVENSWARRDFRSTVKGFGLHCVGSFAAKCDGRPAYRVLDASRLLRGAMRRSDRQQTILQIPIKPRGAIAD
jgi:hypothetical protein